jgi:hypothetical protein
MVPFRLENSVFNVDLFRVLTTIPSTGTNSGTLLQETMRSAGLTMRTRVSDRRHTRTRHWLVWVITASKHFRSTPFPALHLLLHLRKLHRLSSVASGFRSPLSTEISCPIEAQSCQARPRANVFNLSVRTRITIEPSSVSEAIRLESPRFSQGLWRAKGHRQRASSYVCGFTLSRTLFIFFKTSGVGPRFYPPYRFHGRPRTHTFV